MSESMDFGSGESHVDLVSSLRIKQRLGQISTNRLFQSELVPRVAKLGGQTLLTEHFLARLSFELSDFADEHLLGISALALSQVPEIIDNIVEDEDQKENALTLWSQLVQEKIQDDQQALPNMNGGKKNSPSPGLPRKLKKSEHGTRKRGPSHYRRYRRRS